MTNYDLAADPVPPAPTPALPTLLHVTQAFAGRLPRQRDLDLLARIEVGVPFSEIANTQPFRLVAFRALLRDFPNYDPTALWLHAYDCECEVDEPPDPTNGNGPTPSPLSAAIGVASPPI
jgi:hypothetical protein